MDAPRRGFVCAFVCSDYKSPPICFHIWHQNTLSSLLEKKKKKGKVRSGIKVSFMNVITARLTHRDGSETSQTGVSAYLLVLKVFAVN